MKMPNKYVGKRLCDIDSHDLCIDLIKVHKRKKVVGTIDIMTAEECGTPMIALHAGGTCNLLNLYNSMYVDELWYDFIEAIKEINRNFII